MSHSSRRSTGFTLLEMLVIILIVGALAAIAAPGWLAFTNRQRLGRATEQVLQAIRIAQAEAKRTGSFREVRFDTSADPPRFAVLPTTVGTTGTVTPTTSSVNTWEQLGNGNIQAGVLQLVADPTAGSLIFGNKGEIVRNTLAPSNPPAREPLFTVTVRLQQSPNVRRCVRVETLLGAVSQGENAECPP